MGIQPGRTQINVQQVWAHYCPARGVMGVKGGDDDDSRREIGGGCGATIAKKGKGTAAAMGDKGGDDDDDKGGNDDDDERGGGIAHPKTRLGPSGPGRRTMPSQSEGMMLSPEGCDSSGEQRLLQGYTSVIKSISKFLHLIDLALKYQVNVLT
ncbi:hypothetical protein F5887DRAFT_921228 [Amanita rubescens]|nr:hypothetical protein F5887DRAFT_921228 [Amanita rubescens]